MDNKNKQTTQKRNDIKSFCEKEDEYAKVKNIKYIGKVNINGKEKEVYMCELYTKSKDGDLIEIEKVYTEDFECIAANNKENVYGMLLTKEYAGEENLLEKVKENIEKEDKVEKIENIDELTDEEISKVAIELGISEEDVKRMAKTKIEDKEENEIFEDNEEEIIETQETKNAKEIDKEKNKSVMSINPNVKVTERETLASMLNVEGKGYIRFEVVESKEIKDGTNTTRFSIVGIRNENGKEVQEEIDSLEQVDGNLPFKSVNAMNQDGSKIEDKQVQSMFEIKGREDERISIEYDEYNTVKASLVRRSKETNEQISIPIEANTIEETRDKPKEFMNSHKNPHIDNEAKNILEHKEEGCKDYQIEDIDEDPTNDIHSHIEDEYIPGTDIKWIDFANSCGYRGEGAIEAAKRTFEKAKSYAPEGATNEEIAEEKIEEIEEEFEHRKTNEIN